jgi:hypothetical protein
MFTLPAHLLVQARFSRGTVGDAIINTFVFKGAGPDAPTMADVKARLDQFYGGLAGTQVTKIAARLHNSITGVTYYGRPADAAPGIPGEEVAGSVTVASPGGNSLPPDVCTALSYRAALPNGPSRRGRIYFGPLLVAAIDPFGVLAAAFRSDLIQACKGLASTSVANPIEWMIASRKNNTSARIVRGYVDSAMDTQRRRDPITEQFGRTADAWTL